jgi:dTDP-4-dehydrorhamnose reductase
MRFLVTGSAGLVGSYLTKYLEQNHTAYSAYNNSIPESGIPTKLDLLNHNDIKKTMTETDPDVVIHLAAMTDVDKCETQKDLATKINSTATKHLAEQAAKNNIFFLYVSTDYVFDGTKGMRKEGDTPNPIGHYGRTKMEGEQVLYNLKSKWCIARTSTPFGIHKTKKSFPIWVKENLEAKKQINVLEDQFTSPTYVPNLSKMLIEIAAKKITGIIHVAGATRISRYDMAIMVSEKLNLEKSLIKKAGMEQMSWLAKRPQDSSLDVSLAVKTLNEKPQTIQQSLESFCRQIGV